MLLPFFRVGRMDLVTHIQALQEITLQYPLKLLPYYIWFI